jgi:hypothetical protein
MSTAQKDKDSKKAANDIRIGMNSRPRNVIKYTISIVEEQKLREVKFSAVGGSIGTLLDVVEVIKVLKPGLHQQNRITSVAYQTVDSNKTLLNQRLYPKLEVTLSLDEPKNKTEGYQGVLKEDERKKIAKIMDDRKAEREKNGGRGRARRGGFRGRGRRGGFRGRARGRGRGRRGGFRGRGRGRGRGDRRDGPRRGVPTRGRGNNPRGARGNRGRGK